VYTSEGLAEQLRERAAGQRILLARADRGRDVLREQLAEVCTVEQVVVYTQQDVAQLHPDLHARLRQGQMDYITLTSSNIARALVRALDEPARARIREGTIQLVSISEVTTAAVAQLGLPVAAQAATATTRGVIAALVALAQAQRPRQATEGP
jgi:uroporphyrinogen III methyltransferase/synthase